LPSVEITLSTEEGSLDPYDLFPESVEEIWLEIGFGAGEHLTQQAITNPTVGFIGCEPFINGVARLLANVSENNMSNVRIFRDDARLLMRAIPDQCIERTFVLFPDPWPKTRHHKRRIVCPETIESLCRLMPVGSEFRIATDDRSYKEWILQYMLAAEGFKWRAQRPSDWRTRPDDWPETRYERKAHAAGRQCSYFMFDRCS
tara:strand:+ start:2047 stop:2652 length:606 start_codon:yes stop_codon:yes gene_type:complete